MALHDAFLRRTPFELAFPDADAAAEFTSVVASAAEGAGVDPVDRRAFVTLEAVGSFLRRIQPGGTERVGPQATYDYALLLYHAFHFARSGARPLLVSEETARALVEGEGVGGDPADQASGNGVLEVPARAGYAQLPRNLFWIRPSPDEPAEAVDGFFWCLGEADMLHVLLTAGLRDDRPGLAVVPVPEAPWADAADWLDTPIRSRGPDFATTLPGGELEELYSFVAAGEVLKLVARLFAHVRAEPGTPVDGPARPDPSEPTPSTLPYERI
ncbi:MAG: hypothetical protein LJF06_04795 [Gemmatimonadetes bacterium]|nr:hypothetical protein [Gemmatimonadota bacterium]